MTDTFRPSADLRPTLVICAWSPEETGWDPVEDLSGQPWSPPGARTDPVAAAEPDLLAQVLAGKLADRTCRALLLVGRTARGDEFLLQIRADKGSSGRSQSADSRPPGVVRATAPAAEMVRALRDAGLPARVTSESEEDAGSQLLYGLLTGVTDEAEVPAVALLRAPLSAPDAVVQRAVKAVAQTIAARLAPLARTRAA